MASVKHKSAMKAFYAKAGIPTARYHLVEGYDDAVAFANEVGYPVVVKPDNGVGASHTYRLRSDDEVRFFIDTKDDNIYIMEELHTILSLGAGGSTKMVDPRIGRIERYYNCKFAKEYIEHPEKLRANREKFEAFEQQLMEAYERGTGGRS